MVKKIIYKKSNGFIVGERDLSLESELANPLPDDELAVEGFSYKPHAYYNGFEVVDLPMVPEKGMTLNESNLQYVDLRTLEERRTSKWEEIKQARKMATEKPLITPYGIFNADKDAPDNIKSCVQLANALAKRGLPVAINFTLYDDSVIVVNEDMIEQVGLMLGAQVQAARNHATVLRELIFSDTITLEELSAISWDTNA